MSELFITGGRRLSGEVKVQGAKNSALPILAATILSGGISVIHNCPDLSDVTTTLEILRHLGCRVWQEGDTVTVDSGPLDRCDIPERLMREMRSSVIFLGALLARTGQARISLPGGCELGPRPIDLHLAALRRLGADIRERGGSLRCRSRGLRGGEIALPIPSVGATENAMLAACGAEGLTVLYNAAREPEIWDLQQFLNACGAKVAGAGSSTILISGRSCLHSGEHRVIGDRICAATLLSATACAGGEVEVTGVPREQLLPVTQALSEAGCTLCTGIDRVRLTAPGRLHSTSPIRTAPYPGFPTDAQPTLLAALCSGEGTTVFVETMFENRYRCAMELARMGARVRVEGRVAVVTGHPLTGAEVEAPDLRGGAALAVAALAAEGESRITGLHHIDRGYQDFAGCLSALGADVRRTEKEHHH